MITNGGLVYNTGSATVGLLNGCNGNSATIGGGTGTSLWRLNSSQNMVIGNNVAATNNSVTLLAGGVLTNLSSVILGGVNSALNFNGGTLAAGGNGYLIAATNATATNFVQSGGAIIDSVSYAVTNQLPLTEDPNSLGGGLTKLGAGTLALSGANTHSGTTWINVGTLALRSGAAINNSTNISIAAGATLDVSAISAYTIPASATLTASGTASATTIKGNASGTVSLGSQSITLNYDGSHPALSISQGTLVLDGNAFTVNSSVPLNPGVYPVIQQVGGNITSNGVFTVSGTAIGSGYTAIVQVIGTNVVLAITTPTAIDHYDVTAATPQLAGGTFSVTVTAKDVDGNLVNDSSTIVTMSSSGSAQYDSNDDGTFGDNSKQLSSGTFTITCKDNKAETITLTAMDANLKSGTFSSVLVQPGAFAKLQLLVPGETAAPGTPSGQTGSSLGADSNYAFTVTVNAVDQYWNPVTSGDTVGFTSSDAAALLPTSAALSGGSSTFNVTLKTIGNISLTATNLTQGSILSGTKNISVGVATQIWRGDGTANAWDIGVTANWTNTVRQLATVFNNADHVLFDDNGSSTPSINIQGNPAPVSVTVGAVKNYTFSGSGGITGASGLTKNNSGTLTLANTNTYAGNTIINAGVLTVAAGGAINSPAATLNAGATAGASATLTLSGGSANIQTLLATNVIMGGATNSTFNFFGGTLTTSNAATALAANVTLASNALWNINGSWTMNGGTNYVASVQTNGTWGIAYIGNGASNAVVTVNSNAVWRLGNPAVSTTNMALYVGSGGVGTSGNNLLSILNGGQMYCGQYAGAGNISLSIGQAGTTSNGLLVAGDNGAGGKSLLNAGAVRVYIGGTATSTNSWCRVDGGMITNVGNNQGALYSYGVNSSIIVTNGGQIITAGSSWAGRQGLTNRWLVAGADSAGNPSTLNMGSYLNVGGSNLDPVTTPCATNNSLWIGQGGLVLATNSGQVNVGSATNAYGNSMLVTNGGQLLSSATCTIGQYSNANNNFVALGGTFGSTNATWNLGNQNLNIGGTTGTTNNYATLFAGGLLTNVSFINLGGTGSRLNFNGGTLAASTNRTIFSTNATAINPGVFVQAGGAIIDSSAFTLTNALPLLEDAASPGGGLTKLGSGALLLTDISTYTGPTMISAGTLSVNGGLGSTTVTIASNATLGGYGQINGAVTNHAGGTLALGTSIGTLTISNYLTLLANSTNVIKLGKAGSVLTNDLIRGLSTLTLGGTLEIITNSGMSALAAGDSFQLFQATTITGAFAATNLPDISAQSLVWDTSGLNTGRLAVVAMVVNNAPVITVQPTNTTVVLNNNTSLVVVATGTAPLTYQWYANSNLVNNATNSILSLTNAACLDAAAYQVIVTNNYGSATSQVAWLTVHDPNLPAFTTNLPTLTTNLVQGGGLSLQVALAYNCSAPAYQWYFNATNALPGKTAASLTVTNIGLNQAGNYRVVVTNANGSVTSAVVTLGVQYYITNILLGVSGTNFSMQVYGETNRTYQLLGTNDISGGTPVSNWPVIMSVTPTTNGLLELQDATATNQQMVYRIQSQ